MPNLSTKTLMRARARFFRSHSWRSKIRNTASATFRYSPSSAGDELAERRCDARHDRGAAAHAQLEALHAVADARDVGDVVDARDRAVLVGRGEGRLHLARHQLRRGVAHEVAHVGADIRGGVEQLALADAGPRVARHVADGVAAALAAREPRVGQLTDRLGGVAQRDVMELDVLARGDVALVERRVLLHHVGEGLHLLRGDPAEGELHADHLDVGLALAVDALLQPEADELGLGDLTAEEASRPRCRSRRTRAR